MFQNHVVPPAYVSETPIEEPTKFTRKTFDVLAVQLTHANLGTIADWCGGIITEGEGKISFIQLPEVNPMKTHSRVLQGFVKDWVVRIPAAGKNQKDVFAIYKDYAFQRAFERTPEIGQPETEEKDIWQTYFPNSELVNMQQTVKQTTKENTEAVETIKEIMDELVIAQSRVILLKALLRDKLNDDLKTA